MSAENSQIFSQPDFVKFSTENVEPPSAVYLDLNDQLQLFIIYNVTVATVIVRARILRPDGQIVVVEQQFTTPGAYGSKFFYIPMCEGFLLSIVATTNILGQGDISPFVIANIIRSGQTQYQVTMNLLADYVSQNHQAGWTAAGSTPRYNGRGFTCVTNIANPAAGAEIAIVPQLGQIWKVISVKATLLTAAAVANRQVRGQISFGGAVYSSAYAPATQAASLSYEYDFMPNALSNALVVDHLQVTLPQDIELNSAMAFQTVTQFIQAADQWNAIYIIYRGRYSD